MTTERTDNNTDSNCLVSGGQSTEAIKTAVNAGARARIPQAGTRQSNPAAEAAPEPGASGAAAPGEADGSEAPTSFKDAVGASLRSMEPGARKWIGILRPPLFWTEGLPAAGDSWLYAKEGTWCRSDSPIRIVARIWQVITMPLRGVAFYASWLTERFSRFFVFITVYALLASTSYASWLPWIW